MDRSSDLVMRLTGANATDGMFDLVFSRKEGTPRYPYDLILLSCECVDSRISEQDALLICCGWTSLWL